MRKKMNKEHCFWQAFSPRGTVMRGESHRALTGRPELHSFPAKMAVNIRLVRFGVRQTRVSSHHLPSFAFFFTNTFPWAEAVREDLGNVPSGRVIVTRDSISSLYLLHLIGKLAASEYYRENTIQYCPGLIATVSSFFLPQRS